MTIVEHYVMPAGVARERKPLRADRTAIVVIDMVNWQVPREPDASGMATTHYVESLHKTVIPNHVRLIARAHALDVPVVFLRVGYAAAAARDALPAYRVAFLDKGAQDGTHATALIDELSVGERDVSLLKYGSGGYLTSALESAVRNMGVEHVVYTGVLTNGCVLHTATSGFDLGFQGYVLSDATATMTSETQHATLSILGAYCAEVLTTDALLERFEPGRTGGRS